MDVSYKELLATLTTATLQGIQTRESVTGMKQALQNLVRPSSDAKDALAKLGLVGGETIVSQAGGWIPLMTKFRDAVRSGTVELSQLFTSVEGFNYMTAVTGAGWEDFEMILGDMGNAAEMTEQALQKMSHTFRIAWMRFKSEFIAGWIRFGYPVLESMAAGLLVIVNILEKFNKFLSEHQRLSIVIYRTIGLLGTMLVVIGAIAAAIGMARGYILMLKVGFGELYGTIWTLGSRLFWLAAILVVLYEAYRANWAGLKDALAPFFDDLINDIKNSTDILTAAIAWFGEGVSREKVMSLKKRGLLDDALKLHIALSGIRTGFLALVGAIENDLVPPFRILGSVLHGVYTLLQMIGGKTIFPDIAQHENLKRQKVLLEAVSVTWAVVIEWVLKYVFWGVVALKTLDKIKKVVTWLSGAQGFASVGRVMGVLVSKAKTFARWCELSWYGAQINGVKAWNAVKAAAKFIFNPKTYSLLWKIAWNDIKAAGVASWDAIKAAGAWVLAKGALIWSTITGWATATWGWVTAAWAAAAANWAAVTPILITVGLVLLLAILIAILVLTIYHYRKEWGWILQDIGAFFVDLWNTIVQFCINVGIWFKNLWNDFKNWVSESLSSALSTWNTFWSDVWQGWLDFKDRLWEGIKSIPQKFRDALSGLNPWGNPISPPVVRGNELGGRHALGGEFTRSGAYSGIFHQGEIVTTTSTTKKLSAFADKVTGKRGAELGGGIGQTVSFNEGAVSLIVNVANGKDLNTDELADRLFDSIKAKMKELSDRTFRSDEGFSPGVSYG